MTGELNNDQGTDVGNVIANAGLSLSADQLAIMKENADKLLAEKAQAQAKAKSEKAFEELYANTLNDPQVAPLKDLVEEVLAKNPEFKGMGAGGVTVVLRMAKEKWELSQVASGGVQDKKSTDSLGSGAIVAGTQAGANADDKGIPRQEGHPHLIDFSKVDLDKCAPHIRRFAIRQRQKVNHRI